MHLFSRVLWFLGIYPGDPHNRDAILVYVLVIVTGLALFGFFGFLGPKTFRTKMKAVNRWLLLNTTLFPVDPHAPLGRALEQRKDEPRLAVRLRGWLYVQVFGALIVLLLFLFWLLLR